MGITCFVSGIKVGAGTCLHGTADDVASAGPSMLTLGNMEFSGYSRSRTVVRVWAPINKSACISMQPTKRRQCPHANEPAQLVPSCTTASGRSAKTTSPERGQSTQAVISTTRAKHIRESSSMSSTPSPKR
eukprot:8580581-Pyramimonas_sp.AAC.1